MLVATAGHVDHGKTSLVRHITGTNTDRLAEEKQRGLTIELGYAFAQSESGQSIGFIDVPGHHRFINTMISGISAIDLGMLVVAADDGPMPQTIEHLQLLRLLGVTRFIGVVTKTDLVDEARLKEVSQQVSALLPEAPLCEFSNLSGKGLDHLIKTLDIQSKQLSKRTAESQFRMYIDRAFTKKGAGVVVTGTCLSGGIEIGDELTLHSSQSFASKKLRVRAREIHSQGKPATIGGAGQRCALNLAGKVSLEQIQRGDFLCADSTAEPCSRLDARCWTIPDFSARSFKHMGRVKLHIGTQRIGARTYFLDRGEDSAESQRIQLILDNPLVVFSGDRFVLRDDNELSTLGGGIVIDPNAPQWGKTRSDRLQLLDALEADQPIKALEELLLVNGDIVSTRQCQRWWNLTEAEIDALLASPVLRKRELVQIKAGGDIFILVNESWLRYQCQLVDQLKDWHSSRPMEAGVRPETLEALVQPLVPASLFKAVLDDRISAGEVVYQDQLVLARGHRPSLSHKVQREWLQLETLLHSRGVHIPLRSEILADSGFDAKQLEALTRPAIKANQLYEVGDKRLALPATLRELAKLAKLHIDTSGEMSVIEAKRVFGLGRNVTIEVLELFDKIGYTKRSGNARVLANSKANQLI